MAVGKSRRIVIDVDDVGLKRQLYSALAEDGRSLKDWFISAAGKYLDARFDGRRRAFRTPTAGRAAAAKASAKARRAS